MCKECSALIERVSDLEALFTAFLAEAARSRELSSLNIAAGIALEDLHDLEAAA